MASNDPVTADLVARLLLAGDGVVLGLFLGAAALQTWFKYHFSSSALKQIRQAPYVQISDLRSILKPENSNERDAHQESSPVGKLIVVRGQVQAKSAVEGTWRGLKDNLIVSPRSGDRAVLLQRTETCLYNEWRGLIGWTLDLRTLFGRSLKEQVVTSFKSVPFVLVEGWPRADYIVVNLDNSTHRLPLTTVFHQLHPVQASPYTFFQAVFGHGYPVGVLDEEKILPPGKEITAVGVCSLQNGVPEIRSCKWLPIFLSDLTKDQLEVDLAIGTKILFCFGAVLSAVAIGILSFAIRRNWGRWKEWRQQRSAQQPTDPPAGSSYDEETGDVPDGELCVICLMNRRRSAFIPCGHRVCCPRCALEVERETTPRCPLCRQTIRNSIRIYDS